MKDQILNLLGSGHPWQDTIQYYETITSTNDVLKQMALNGAPVGTVLVADEQTGGRGRLGRTFLSPPASGIYMSVLLRPNCSPDQIMHLTCGAAAAMCEAIEASCGFRPGIKWTNDIVYSKHKLAGILTELGFGPGGVVSYAVIGIGVNCCQTSEDFASEIRSFAGSLSMFAPEKVDRAKVAAEMIRALESLSASLLTDKSRILANYRADCVTLGQTVSVVTPTARRIGTALDIDEEGALIVRYEDGSVQTVNTGEVSVRGMYGYI